MLTLKTVPQRRARALGANRARCAAPDVWEGDLSVGRAKVYLVGNPFAEEAGALAGVPDPHLQVGLVPYLYFCNCCVTLVTVVYAGDCHVTVAYFGSCCYRGGAAYGRNCCVRW